MEISERALDIIKEFEGLRLDAYLDPVGIPTIGYGAIRYPNGRKVRMGDSISESEAEAFLKHECDKVAADLTERLKGIDLGQNQFDALVSFCFNIGLGAFAGSTLFKKLRQSDFAAAADEFRRWNKGTVNGVKQELPGLTRRRAKERELFLKTTAGGTPLREEPSDEDRAVTAKGFRTPEGNTIVTFDAAGSVVEIMNLADNLPATFTAALGYLPNLRAFEFASTAEAVPAGPARSLSSRGRPIVAVADPPKLERPLLQVGMEDSEEVPGNDIREMQDRLAQLGYYEGEINGAFDAATDDAVRDFQEDYFGLAEADGKVGPITWGKLWGDAKPPKTAQGTPVAGKNHLLLTKTSEKDRYGCVVLILEYFRDGLSVDSIEVCSGAPSRQKFHTGPDSVAMSLEPLPEGKWHINDVIWENGKDNYSGRVRNNGVGPAKILLDYKEPGRTRRSAILIHIDWNRQSAPGTAGCVGVQNIADFKRMVTWLRETNPRDLYVDWGLGTCPRP